MKGVMPETHVGNDKKSSKVADTVLYTIKEQ